MQAQSEMQGRAETNKRQELGNSDPMRPYGPTKFSTTYFFSDFYVVEVGKFMRQYQILEPVGFPYIFMTYSN